MKRLSRKLYWLLNFNGSTVLKNRKSCYSMTTKHMNLDQSLSNMTTGISLEQHSTTKLLRGSPSANWTPSSSGRWKRWLRSERKGTVLICLGEFTSERILGQTGTQFSSPIHSLDWTNPLASLSLRWTLKWAASMRTSEECQRLRSFSRTLKTSKFRSWIKISRQLTGLNSAWRTTLRRACLPSKVFHK